MLFGRFTYYKLVAYVPHCNQEGEPEKEDAENKQTASAEEFWQGIFYFPGLSPALCRLKIPVYEAGKIDFYKKPALR